ncbi:leucine-rich repeat extensin-like protein 4 [Hibiscus syriacus]|uniref:leucine-rich repeat extensin-like protein 4 n=1 Tax=Hibiscus syriacus TaxID=106335 RepID=UPI0019229A90|nr:leucine-rich repeat extensin-like protein 4 [Hibiscus syriacus]
MEIVPNEAAITAGGGVGISIGNSGDVVVGGVWIGGGIGNTQTPPSGPSVSKLSGAYTALQAWKSAITDDPLGILKTWVGSDVRAYKGVFCAMDSDSETFVAAIALNHANLQGILVSEFSVLTDVSIIHLNSNRFSGTVHDTFRGLSSLQELDLGNNHLSGPFPTVTL